MQYQRSDLNSTQENPSLRFSCWKEMHRSFPLNRSWSYFDTVCTIMSISATIIQSLNLIWFRLVKKTISKTVALKSDQGHWKWYASIWLSWVHHYAKFEKSLHEKYEQNPPLNFLPSPEMHLSSSLSHKNKLVRDVCVHKVWTWSDMNLPRK